jgi:signal transduction histidine kinase
MTISPAYVQASAVVCGLLSLLYGWLRWRHRDPGAQWFALGFLMVFAIFAFGLRQPPSDAAAHRGASLLGALGVLCVGFGMVDYLGLAERWAWRWRGAIALPLLVGLAWLPFGALPRATAHLLVAAALIVMAALVWIESRRKLGTGLRLIVAALLLHPMILAVMLFAGVNTYELRNVVILPLSVLGMTLFAISLTRTRVHLEQELAGRAQAQRALEQLNESLEHLVAERTEDLHEIIAGLESFSRSVSHDLRGPLGGIAGLSRIAQGAIERGETERALPMLGAIAAQADTLGALVNDLLALARVGEATLSLTRVDLNDCLRQAMQQLHVAGQPVEAVESTALGSADADTGLLRQVFVNLVGNALKFSRDVPQPRVRVELVPDAGRVVVAVRDNGTGFDPQRAAELFEPFKRLHSAAFEGTGLGLAIVRRIVERHGGAVWADSPPGEGANFYVALPLARS